MANLTYTINKISINNYNNSFDDHNNNAFNDNYIIIKHINDGGYGSIMLAYDIKKNKEVAIKIITSNYNSEMQIINQININYHDNIIKIYDFYIINNELYIITEYINGLDLFDYITANEKISNEIILNISIELCLGLIYLKNNEIIHFDLKPENIMINENNKPIIIDFGSAIINNNFKNFSNTYTYSYQPPEFYLDNTISYASDIWALGCILYSLIARVHPFNLYGNKTKNETINSIIYDKVLFTDPIWLNIPKKIIFLIDNMLNKNVNSRFTIENIYIELTGIKL